MRLSKFFCKVDRKTLRLIPNMKERKSKMRLWSFPCLNGFHYRSSACYVEHRTGRTEGSIGKEMTCEVAIPRAPCNTFSFEHQFKTRIVPYIATTDKCACKLIWRFCHLQIFEQVLKTFTTRVREMFGRCGKIFCTLTFYRKFGGKKDIVLGSCDALFGEHIDTFFEKKPQFT